MNFYKISSQDTTEVGAFYFEVEDDKVIRQIENYNDCWIYSGDPLSFCPRREIDGNDAFGNLTPNPMSEMMDEMSETDPPFKTIEAEEFETAWQTAIEKVVHAPSK